MKNKWIVVTVLILCTLFVGFLFTSFQKEFRREKLPVLGSVKPFTLVDINNQEFKSSRLEGKVWVASFLFTTCSDICPIMSKHLASLGRSFDLEPGIRIVSFSVNPEVDTPERLKQYAQQYNANTNKWFFLTGPREVLKDIALNSFKLGSIEEPIFHSAYFALVDRYGVIRGYYDGTKQEEVNTLFKTSAKLLKQR